MNQDVAPFNENNEGFGDSLVTRVVKAGHRTYFIDVKSTRANDYFLSLTELRKKNTASGVITERNKVFIFKEDIEKISQALNEVIEKMQDLSK